MRRWKNQLKTIVLPGGLSALLVGYNSDSVADLAGKRIKALTVTPETPGG